MPYVTVIMPVFNGGRYLAPAIRSMLNQTCADFEFLIIDDASTDDTSGIVRSFGDSRIKLVRHEVNQGVAGSLNEGLSIAKGKYVARMDADDVACKTRLAAQVEFMEAHPKIGVSGTWFGYFGAEPFIKIKSPTGAPCVRACMLFDNPLYHPTVIIRKEVLEQHGLRYDPAFSRSEDFDLWQRASGLFDVDNLPSVQMYLRVHSASVTQSRTVEMGGQTASLLRRELMRLGMEPSENDMTFHCAVGRGLRMESIGDVERAENWINKLLAANEQGRVYDREGLAEAAGMIWFRLCLNSATLGRPVRRAYASSSLSKGYSPSRAELLGFDLRVLWHGVRRLAT